MAEQSGAAPKSRICPFLGLENDRSSHRVIPVAGHRCHAGPVPVEIDFERQSYYCLSGRFELCPRRVLGAPEEPPAEVAAEAAVGVLPDDPVRGRSGRTRVLAAAAAVCAVAVVVVVALSGALSGTSNDSTQAGAAPPAPASPVPATREVEPAQPVPAIQPVLLQTPVPPAGTVLAGGSSAMPTPAVPSPSPSTTASSTLRTYLVPYGDTLTQISTRFGVPVEDIMKANNIPNRDVILAGRTIVIPNPR